MAKERLRVGWGSAYAEDNLAPALALAEHGDLDFLCFDALAERTLALAHIRRRRHPDAGYDLRLDEFGTRFLPYAARGLRLVTNMGAANPEAAAARLSRLAHKMGVSVKIAAVVGDDVLDRVLRDNPVLDETGRPLSEVGGQVVSANAYLGAEGIIQALDNGARIVVGGRLADPSLFLGAARWAFEWPEEDWARLGQGIVTGHLLECGMQVTGGNYADPPYRVVPGLDDLGMPLAEVTRTGEAVIGKLPSSGGMVTPNTVKAQLVYEIHDPARYLTPDVVADFRAVTVRAVGRDRVLVTGGRGSERPGTLKVLVGVDEGFFGEAEVSFAGPGAYDRAKLCRDVLKARYDRYYQKVCEDVRFDFIGVNALHGPAAPRQQAPPYEVRLRMAVRARSYEAAFAVTQEVEWQYFGPAGAGGMRRAVRPALAMYSTKIPRKEVAVRAFLV